MTMSVGHLRQLHLATSATDLSTQDDLPKLAQASDVEHHLEIHEIILGIAARRLDAFHLEVGICMLHGQYSTDALLYTIPVDEDPEPAFVKHTIHNIKKYAEQFNRKFVGAGLTAMTASFAPGLAAKLWKTLDVVPLIFPCEFGLASNRSHPFTMDGLADSMARQCALYFGPNGQPNVQIGFRNMVDVDSAGHTPLTTLDQYEKSVGKSTWDATMYFVNRLKERDIRMAFFSSTPQGGGVALMRHALVRFLRLLNIDIQWYVPIPSPPIFRVTKNNHNILQGVAAPEERLSDHDTKLLNHWAHANAEIAWIPEHGPLRAPSEGGAHFIVVDDHQLPSLVDIAKKADPKRPVAFRSHVQIRGDLVDKGDDNATQHVFEWLYGLVKEADLFISHPVSSFVPKMVKPETVTYLPATTDWLDGLNKELSSSESRYYLDEYNLQCRKANQPLLTFPARDYIIQIARFDPSKGIPDVLASYAKLRHTYLSNTPQSHIPQLVITGHGAIDDPDFTLIMAETAHLLATKYSDIAPDISVVRLSPTDQILNALLSNAKIALQLSTREGFEVKVSEALHKGVPVITTKAGGISLQIEDGRSGFLVEVGDSDAVAKYMDVLLKDGVLYEKMSEYAATHVSDEVGTVGNALAWLYFADVMTAGEEVKPYGRWVNDLARERAGVPYEDGEIRLDRHLST